MKVVLCTLVSLCLLAAPASAQQNSEGKQNPLLDGKLMYVGSMPNNIDAWIVHDLSAWGKYRPTREIEGVDLVMKAYKPETEVEYKMRRGIPQPKEVQKDRARKHVMFSVVVTDWVTGNQVWQADIMDRNPKSNESSAPSEDAGISARGLSSEHLAQAITRELRRYVDHLGAQARTP